MPSGTTSSGSGGAGLSLEQIIALWIRAGGPVATAPVAAARAMAESGGRPAVTSANPDGGTNVGIWQLDTRGVGAGQTVAALSDPLANAKITVAATSGGTDWSEWSDNYQPYLALAQSDVSAFRAKASGHPGGLLGLAGDILHGIASIDTSLLRTAASGAGAAAGQLLQLPAQLTGFLTALEQPARALMWIINPANVARVIAGVAGFLLLGAGLLTLGMAA